MKKSILTIVITLIAGFAMAGGEKYQQIMGETLAQYAHCQTIDDYQALANKFNLIANKEKTEWLPLYYRAHSYIMMSFMEAKDAVKKDAYLDEAEKSLNKMIEMQAQESEVYALQAFYFTARLVVNPMARGQKYSALSAQAVGKALAFDPSNPRAKYINLSNEMGSARFFGKDPAQYCAEAKELFNNWDQFKIKSPIYPSWGKRLVKNLMSRCK